MDVGTPSHSLSLPIIPSANKDSPDRQPHLPNLDNDAEEIEVDLTLVSLPLALDLRTAFTAYSRTIDTRASVPLPNATASISSTSLSPTSAAAAILFAVPPAPIPASGTTTLLPADGAAAALAPGGPLGMSLPQWMRLCSDVGLPTNQGGPIAGSTLQTIHAAYRPHGSSRLPYVSFVQAIAALSCQLRSPQLVETVGRHGAALYAAQRQQWRLQMQMTAISAPPGTRTARLAAQRSTNGGEEMPDAPLDLTPQDVAKEVAILTELKDQLNHESGPLSAWVPREPPDVQSASDTATAAWAPQHQHQQLQLQHPYQQHQQAFLSTQPNVSQPGAATRAVQQFAAATAGGGVGVGMGMGGGAGGGGNSPGRHPGVLSGVMMTATTGRVGFGGVRGATNQHRKPRGQKQGAAGGTVRGGGGGLIDLGGNPYLQGVLRSKYFAPQLRPLRYSPIADSSDMRSYYFYADPAAASAAAGGPRDPWASVTAHAAPSPTGFYDPDPYSSPVLAPVPGSLSDHPLRPRHHLEPEHPSAFPIVSAAPRGALAHAVGGGGGSGSGGSGGFGSSPVKLPSVTGAVLGSGSGSVAEVATGGGSGGGGGSVLQPPLAATSSRKNALLASLAASLTAASGANTSVGSGGGSPATGGAIGGSGGGAGGAASGSPAVGGTGGPYSVLGAMRRSTGTGAGGVQDGDQAVATLVTRVDRLERSAVSVESRIAHLGTRVRAVEVGGPDAARRASSSVSGGPAPQPSMSLQHHDVRSEVKALAESAAELAAQAQARRTREDIATLGQQFETRQTLLERQMQEQQLQLATALAAIKATQSEAAAARQEAAEAKAAAATAATVAAAKPAEAAPEAKAPEVSAESLAAAAEAAVLEASGKLLTPIRTDLEAQLRTMTEQQRKLDEQFAALALQQSALMKEAARVAAEVTAAAAAATQLAAAHTAAANTTTTATATSTSSPATPAESASDVLVASLSSPAFGLLTKLSADIQELRDQLAALQEAQKAASSSRLPTSAAAASAVLPVGPATPAVGSPGEGGDADTATSRSGTDGITSAFTNGAPGDIQITSSSIPMPRVTSPGNAEGGAPPQGSVVCSTAATTTSGAACPDVAELHAMMQKLQGELKELASRGLETSDSKALAPAPAAAAAAAAATGGSTIPSSASVSKLVPSAASEKSLLKTRMSGNGAAAQSGAKTPGLASAASASARTIASPAAAAMATANSVPDGAGGRGEGEVGVSGAAVQAPGDCITAEALKTATAMWRSELAAAVKGLEARLANGIHNVEQAAAKVTVAAVTEAAVAAAKEKAAAEARENTLHAAVTELQGRVSMLTTDLRVALVQAADARDAAANAAMAATSAAASVSVLIARSREASETAQDTGPDAVAVRQAVADLRQQVAEYGSRLTALEAGSAAEGLAAADVSSLTVQVDQLRGGVTSRFDELAAQLAALTAAQAQSLFGTLGGQVEELGVRMADVETLVGALREWRLKDGGNKPAVDAVKAPSSADNRLTTGQGEDQLQRVREEGEMRDADAARQESGAMGVSEAAPAPAATPAPPTPQQLSVPLPPTEGSPADAAVVSGATVTNDADYPDANPITATAQLTAVLKRLDDLEGAMKAITAASATTAVTDASTSESRTADTTAAAEAPADPAAALVAASATPAVVTAPSAVSAPAADAAEPPAATAAATAPSSAESLLAEVQRRLNNMTAEVRQNLELMSSAIGQDVDHMRTELRTLVAQETKVQLAAAMAAGGAAAPAAAAATAVNGATTTNGVSGDGGNQRPISGTSAPNNGNGGARSRSGSRDGTRGDGQLVRALQERLTTLESELADVVKDARNMNREVVDVCRAADMTTESLELLTQHMRTLDQTQRDMSRQLTEMQQQLAEVVTATATAKTPDSAGATVTASAAAITAGSGSGTDPQGQVLAAALAELKSQLAELQALKLSQRVQALESAPPPVMSIPPTLQALLLELSGQVDHVAQMVREHEHGLDMLAAVAEGASNGTQNVTARMDALDAVVANLRSAVAAAAAARSTVAAGTADAKAGGGESGGPADRLRTAGSNVSGSAAAAALEAAATVAAMEETRSAVSELQERMVEVEKGLTVRGAAVVSLAQDLTAMTRRLEDMDGRVSEATMDAAAAKAAMLKTTAAAKAAGPAATATSSAGGPGMKPSEFEESVDSYRTSEIGSGGGGGSRPGGEGSAGLDRLEAEWQARLKSAMKLFESKMQTDRDKNGKDLGELQKGVAKLREKSVVIDEVILKLAGRLDKLQKKVTDMLDSEAAETMTTYSVINRDRLRASRPGSATSNYQDDIDDYSATAGGGASGTASRVASRAPSRGPSRLGQRPSET